MKLLIKVLLVSALLFFLAQKGFLSFEETRNAFFNSNHVWVGYFCLILSTSLSFLRWQILLQAQKIRIPFLKTVELCFVGFFFNIALPGAASGDLIKSFYIGREVKGHGAVAFSSSFFDRAAGASSLVIVSLVAFVLSQQFPWSAQLLRPFQITILAAGALIISFYTYLFAVGDRVDPVLAVFKKLEQLARPLRLLTEVYQGIRHYRHQRQAVGLALLISFFIHASVCFAFSRFALAFDQTQVPFFAIVVVSPLALLVTAVPILPGGIGTGHAAFLGLFALLGSDRGADMFTLFFLFQIFLGLLGGLLYLRFKLVLDPELAHTG